MTKTHDNQISGLVGTVMDRLARDIAKADCEQSSREIDHAQPEHHAKIDSPSLVRESNGWGRRYIVPTILRGDEWRAAYDQAAEITRKCGLVALLGNRGTGKTQIAAEITRNGMFPAIDTSRYTNGCKISSTDKKSVYRRAIDIYLDLRDAAKNHTPRSEKEVLASLHDCGLLVIDEFQERGETDWENRIISNLIDKRYSDHRATIIIANLTRPELYKSLGASVVDRARENGRSIECCWDSYREKANA